jgi:hypothetical protein
LIEAVEEDYRAAERSFEQAVAGYRNLEHPEAQTGGLAEALEAR